MKALLLVVLVYALAACQGANQTQELDVQTAEPAAASATATASGPSSPPPAESGPVGLMGQVISASDVAGQPDQPLADQMVLAFPLELAGEILGSADPTDEELRFLKADLAEADPAMAVSLSGAGGEYTLLLDPGHYILCVADSEQTPPGFPAITRGCGRTEVIPGKMRAVDISSGFGEILLVER